jgi:hypothetical protein
MLKKKKQQFATNIDDEKITKGHYIVGKINLRVGKKTTKCLPLKKCKNTTQNFKTWIQTYVRKTKEPKTKRPKDGCNNGGWGPNIIKKYL